MNARFQKILILFLCGALLLVIPASAGFLDFIFGTPAPTPAPSVSTGGGTTSQVTAANPDLGTILALLRTINDQVSLVAENTRPQGKGILSGNVVLFDSAGNAGNAIQSGSAVAAVPQGTCDIALYSSVRMRTTVEEMKDYASSNNKYSRNRQACIDSYLCRKTVSTDESFSFLYFEYTASDPAAPLSRVTLSYRCPGY